MILAALLKVLKLNNFTKSSKERIPQIVDKSPNQNSESRNKRQKKSTKSNQKVEENEEGLFTESKNKKYF